ncbi:DNA-binding transcriptional regulator, LacI/PurR family [Arthrobacter sp. 9AX]|uniref:substrate-binding domain-containing protein n=1 Tax=Arthrobacter sp. 9AX TaxID=2653131 RepID=UPI0012F00DA7|nr:substrate-binding domain-containing protein [Arthrobacter sp. 9AX]VXC19474.1 DNA-binding transcriptional regulator, LacI/PurR family [Arthrobacter sp. 9AX]
MVKGSGRPTIADVAETSGYSRATVSMALSGKGRIDSGTRAKVRAVAEELGYRPSVRAQRLRGGRSNTVALITALPAPIVAEASNYGFLLDLALPIAQECLLHGYSLLLVPPLTSPNDLALMDIDGAIVDDPRTADPITAELRARGVVVVTVGRSGGTMANGFVDRGHSGGDVMIDHFRERGSKFVAVLLSEEPHSVAVSVSAYVSALPPSSMRVVTAHARAVQGEEAGYKATVKLLREHPGIDAIYASLDAFATGALRAAVDLGYDVPADIIIGTNYDGRRSSNSVPQLTSLNLNFPDLAKTAVALLHQLLTGDTAVQSATAPTPLLITRASTSRPVP